MTEVTTTAAAPVAKTAVITVESHNSIVGDLEAYIATLEAKLIKVYSKNTVIVSSVGAAIVGLVLGYLI